MKQKQTGYSTVAFIFHSWVWPNARKSLILLVAREGIEPPTRGFSGVPGGYQDFINQSLASDLPPLPWLIKAQSWHTKSEFDTGPSLGDSSRRIEPPDGLPQLALLYGYFATTLPFFPHIYRGAMHARDFTCRTRAFSQTTAYTRGELSTFFGRFDRVFKAHAPQVSVLPLNSHILSNDPPGGRYRGN